MSITRTLALTALLAVFAAPALRAGTEPGPGDVEARFDDALLKDVISGVLPDAQKEIRLTFDAHADTALTVKLTSSKNGGAGGLMLTLCDEQNVDLGIAGGAFDRSKPEKNQISWKKVLLPEFGTYTLVVQAATPGDFELVLKGALPKLKQNVTSDEDLAIDAEASLDFQGLPGDVVKFSLAAGSKSKFKGQAVRIERPDGSFLDDVPQSPKGNVVLDARGTHRFVFTNTGKLAGAWRAKLSDKPASPKKRTGLVSAAQIGLRPVVKSIDPVKGVHRETDLRMTLHGRDFQPGMDVRLTRKGRLDIIGTGVDVLSSTEATVSLDLHTVERDGENSVGSWKVSVWNVPIYGDPVDATTLDKTSPLNDQKKSFNSVSSGSVRLPDGVEDGTEVWVLAFNDDFQNDLNRMGLGSSDVSIRRATRVGVEAYVLAYVRDLFRVNETNGTIKSGAAIPLSFVIDDLPDVAGDAGDDFNRIEVGGAWVEGDPRDEIESVLWGFAPIDVGNAQREDLSVFAADGVTRTGLGARTRALDPDVSSASFRTAMSPLLNRPLDGSDGKYLAGSFNSSNTVQMARYQEIVDQLERASREIAAIVGHHIGRAMGLATNGLGPMAAPATSGKLWTERNSLDFDDADANTLRNGAAVHDLPGKSDRLKVKFFRLADSQPELLPNLTTGTTYAATWNFVGGRCNAESQDYRMQYVAGSLVPQGLTLTFDGLAGNAPVCLGNGSCSNISQVYCAVLIFQLAITDTVRDDRSFHLHRLKVLPNVSQVPSALRPQAQRCFDEVLAAQ